MHINKGKFIVILGFGFFSISVQALLFRDFLSIYEGTELAVGFFYFAWFLWIAAGAFTGKLIKQNHLKHSSHRRNNFELFLLIYIPAYFLEYLVIQHTRTLCGIPSYELFPLFRMVPLSFFALAPVSFCTGLFFTMACAWMTGETKARLPVASVYIAEVAGGCIGGVFVTLSLSAGMPQESVFLFTALLPGVCVFIYRLLFHKTGKPLITGLILGIVLLVLTGLVLNMTGRIWTNTIRRSQWSRLLPPEHYQGSFSTSRGLYHFGEYKGIFTVISWGTVCENYPDPLTGGEIAALHLAQDPGARKVLVIGQGALSVCREFLRFPHIQQVVWTTPDPAYAGELIKVLPARYKEEISGLTIHKGDIKELLSQDNEIYNLIIIHLPDPATLILNQYFTREFYLTLTQHMSTDSILSVQTQGGENCLGGELVLLGASLFETLKSVFKNIVIKPGEQSWLLASNSEKLSGSLSLLKKRYREFQCVENIFPVQGLDLLYQEDRAVFQQEKYENAVKEFGKDFLINTAARPGAMLYHLLFSLKQAGNVLLDPVVIEFLMKYGFYLVIGGILLYCMFRIPYRSRSSGSIKQGIPISIQKTPDRFDNLFLVFSAGLAGISVSEVLIFFYQFRFGNLYLHIGLISALFMLGLCAGGILIRCLLLHRNREPWYFLPSILIINLLFLVLLFLFNRIEHPFFYVLLFFICGGIFGCYIPIIAFRQKKEDSTDQQSGAMLELSDHLGAAMGGLVTGVILIPVSGVSATLIILCFLLGINLILHLFSRVAAGRKKETNGFKVFIRIAGYCSGGLSLFLVIVLPVFNNMVYSKQDPFSQAARVLARGSELEQKSIRETRSTEIPYYLVKGNGEERETGSTEIPYYLVKGNGEERYIFSTEYFARDITGYGGPVSLAVMVTGSGELLDYTIIKSTETPAYLDYVSGILPSRLIGRNIFDPESVNQVDSVTGATMTSLAIINTLGTSGIEFARKALGKGVDKKIPGMVHWSQGAGLIILFFLLVISLFLRKYPSLWGRGIFLFVVIILCGVIFNIQYSTDHLFRLGFLPFARDISISIFLIAGIPIITLLCGNIYCGYLCPFGALQELIGELRPIKLNTSPDKDRFLHYSRYIKYILLFSLAIAGAAIMNPSVFLFDPLTGFFRFHGGIIIVLFCLFILVLSFFFPRIWCRSFCPAGAFLSLIGKIRLLRFLVPRIMPRYCDLGVKSNADMDCICCDRCRITAYQNKMTMRKTPGQDKEWVFLFMVIIITIMIVLGQFLPLKQPAGKEQETISVENTEGKARNVEMERIETLIQEGFLSDHESEFYKKLDLKEK
ncbi:MAG: 4Fe-4S binding protein [Spirochaetales bacterium]|nr:4Fe-4S binding protein [Spirochaetales bacterium]